MTIPATEADRLEKLAELAERIESVDVEIVAEENPWIRRAAEERRAALEKRAAAVYRRAR
jgi:hypothetical protein